MRSLLGAALAGFALAGPARAAEVPLTLADALAAADRQNPELLAARERAASQAAQADAARRGRLPRVTLSSGWTRTDNPALVFSQRLNAGGLVPDDLAIERLNDPASLSHLTSAAAVELPLDVFGKIGDAARTQASAARAASALAREAALELRLRVVEAYRRADLARRALAVTERALDGARAREADVEARVQEGALLQSDLLRARARRRQREADLADRRGDAAVAAAALSRLLGAAPDTVFVPVDAQETPPALAGDEPSWIARALVGRPVIDAARDRVEAARRALRIEARGLLPDLVAYGQIQDDRSELSAGARSFAVGLGLRWSAFDPARGRREAAAEAGLRAAEHEQRAVVDQVRLDVATSYRRAQSARERWRAAAGGAEEGREALRVVQERRRAGMATLTDELETDAASLGAELEEIGASAQAAVADAALERAVGASAGPETSASSRSPGKEN